MKQKRVYKNTNLVTSEYFKDFTNRLLNKFLEKRNKECEKNLSKFC